MDDANLKANEKSKYLAKLKKLLAAKERKLERCLRAERSKAHVRRKIKEHSLISAKEREGKHSHNYSKVSSEYKKRSQDENQSNFCAHKSVVSKSNNIGTREIKERKNVVISEKVSERQSQDLFENKNNPTSTIPSSVDKSRRAEISKVSKSSNVIVTDLLTDEIKNNHLESSLNIQTCSKSSSYIVSDNLKSTSQCESKQICDEDPNVSNVSSNPKDSNIKDHSSCHGGASCSILRDNSVLLKKEVSCNEYFDENSVYNDNKNCSQSQTDIGRTLPKFSLSKIHSQHSETITNETNEEKNHNFNSSGDVKLRKGTLRKQKTKRKQNQFSDSPWNLEKLLTSEKSPLLLNSDHSELTFNNSVDPSDNVPKNDINSNLSSQTEKVHKRTNPGKHFSEKDAEYRKGNDFIENEQRVDKDSLFLCQDVVPIENTEEKVEDSENVFSEDMLIITPRGSSSLRKVVYREKSRPSTPVLVNSIPVDLNKNSEKLHSLETGDGSVTESPTSSFHTPVEINSVKEKVNTILKESNDSSSENTCKRNVRKQDSKLRRSRSSTPKSSSSTHLKIKFSECQRDNETYRSSFPKVSSSSKDILDADSGLWESQISKNHKLQTEDDKDQCESTSECLLSINDEDKLLEPGKTELSHIIPESPPYIPINSINHSISKTCSESYLVEQNQASIISNSKTSSQNSGVLTNPRSSFLFCEKNTANNGKNTETRNTDNNITSEQNQVHTFPENDSLKTSEPIADQEHVSESKKSPAENTENSMALDSSKSCLLNESLDKSASMKMKTDADDEIPSLDESRIDGGINIQKHKEELAKASSQIHEEIRSTDTALISEGKQNDDLSKTAEVLQEVVKEADDRKRSDNEGEDGLKESTSSVKGKTCFKRIKKGNAKKGQKEILQDSEVNSSDKASAYDTESNILETLNQDKLPVSNMNVSIVSDNDGAKDVNEKVVSVTNEHNASDFKVVKEKKRKFQYPSIPDRLKFSPKETHVKQRAFIKPKMLKKQTAFETVQEQLVVTVTSPEMDEKVASVFPENPEPKTEHCEKIVAEELRVNNDIIECTTRYDNSGETNIPKESNLMEHATAMNAESNQTVMTTLPSAPNLIDLVQNKPKEIYQSCNTNEGNLPETSNLQVYDTKSALNNSLQKGDACQNDISETSNLEEGLICDKVSPASTSKPSTQSRIENNPGAVSASTESLNGVDAPEAKSVESVELKTVPLDTPEPTGIDAVLDEMLFDTCNFDDVELSQLKKPSEVESKISPSKSPINQKETTSHPVIDDILFAPENFDDIDIIDPMDQNPSDRSVEKHSNVSGLVESSSKSMDTNIQTDKIIMPKFVSFCPASKISSKTTSESEKYNEKACITPITNNSSLENDLEEILNKRNKKFEDKIATNRGSVFHTPKLGVSLEDNLQAVLNKGQSAKSFSGFKPASIKTPSSLSLEDQFEEILKKKKPIADMNVSLKRNLSTPKCETSLEDELESMLSKRKEGSGSTTSSFMGMSFKSAKQEMKRPTFENKISLDKKSSTPNAATTLEDEFESILMKRKGSSNMTVAHNTDVSFRSAKQDISNVKIHSKLNSDVPQTNAQKCMSKLEKDLDDILNKTSSTVKMTAQKSKIGTSNIEDELEAIIKNGGKTTMQPHLIQKGGFGSAKSEITNVKTSSVEDEFEEMLKKKSNVTPIALISKGFQTPKCHTRNTSLSKTNENNHESPLSSKIDLKSFMSRPRRSNSFIPVTPKIKMNSSTIQEDGQSPSFCTAKVTTPCSSKIAQNMDISTPKQELNYQSPQIGKIQKFSRRKQGSPYIPVVPKNRTSLATKEPISKISEVHTSTVPKDETKPPVILYGEPSTKTSSSDSLSINSKDEKVSTSADRDFDPMHNSEMMFVLSDANDFFDEEQSDQAKNNIDDQDLKEKILTDKKSDAGSKSVYSTDSSKHEEKISSSESKPCVPSLDQNLDQVNKSDDSIKKCTNIDNLCTNPDLSVSKDESKQITPSTTPKSSSSKGMVKNTKRRSIYESFYDGLHNLEKSKDQSKQVIGFKVSKEQVKDIPDPKTPEQTHCVPEEPKPNISERKSLEPTACLLEEPKSNMSERTSVAAKPLMSGPRKEFKPVTSSPPANLEPSISRPGKAPFVNNQRKRQPFLKVPLISHEDEDKNIPACQEIEKESSKNVHTWRKKINTRKRNLENHTENCSRFSQVPDRKRLKTDEDAVMISDSQMEKIFCSSFDMSVNQEEDSIQEDGSDSRIHTDHLEPQVKPEKSLDIKDQNITTNKQSSAHTDILHNVDATDVNHKNPNKLTEGGDSKASLTEIVGEEEKLIDKQPYIKQEKDVECIEYSQYTELDLLDYSQFEFSEDFLSTEHSDTKNSRKRKRGHIGNAIQRRSPRISTAANSSVCSQSVELTNSQRTRRKKYLSRAETCLVISSVFQYLVDEVNRKKEESDFCLPLDNFQELMSAKLSCKTDELNTKTEEGLSESKNEKNLKLLDENISLEPKNVPEKEMHAKMKDESKSFRVSPTVFLDSQTAHKQSEMVDDSISEPRCYHRNDALDSQQAEISAVAETDENETNRSSNSSSSNTIEERHETLKEDVSDESSRCKKSAKVNLMLDRLESRGEKDLHANVLSDRVQQETIVETDHEVSLELFEDRQQEEENVDSSLMDLKSSYNKDLDTLSFDKADFYGERDGSYLLPPVDTPKDKLCRKMSDRSIKSLSKFIGTMVGSLGTQKSSTQTAVECPKEEMTDFTSSPFPLDLEKQDTSPTTEQCYLNTQIKDLLTKSFETEAVYPRQPSNDKEVSRKRSMVEENLESLLNRNGDSVKESDQIRSDLSDKCKKDLDILFGVEAEDKTDIDEEEAEVNMFEDTHKLHEHTTPNFTCTSKNKRLISCATSTPKIPKMSKSQRDPTTTPKDSHIRRAFSLSPLIFSSQTTPFGKGPRPRIKGRLFDDSGLSLDMSSRPFDVDDDEDGVLPIECLKLTREENVVYVNGGQYTFNGSLQDYIVCILPTTISVWTKGGGEEWENELEWFLSPNYQATCGWSLKKENHVIMLTMEENKDGDQKLSLFFYDLTSGESNMAAIDIQNEKDSPVTNILCCALDDAVVICSNHPTTFSVSKYTLTPDRKHLTLCCHLEGSPGHLIDMQDVCHLDRCIMGLTGEGEAVLWNHETGRITKRIDLCSGVLSDVSLTAVRSVKDGLLFHLMYRMNEATPGFSLMVNSEKESSFIQHDYQPLQHSWRGLKSMKAMEDTLIAVDFSGNMGLWEMDSGKLLAALVKSDVTCVGFSGSRNKLIYFGLKTGVVHVYSLQQ